MHSRARRSARVPLSSQLTVAINDETTGACLGYGVIADVSESGACVWTSGPLARGSRLRLLVNCASATGSRQITGRVVWEGDVPPALAAASGLRRFGVEWQEAALPCIQQLREQALRSFEESLAPSRHCQDLAGDALGEI